MTQQRAIKTYAVVQRGAATEFAEHGYAGASVNRLLKNTGSTKGALYFHFVSKQGLAEAVQDAAAEVYADIAERWAAAEGVDSLDAIAGMVDDAAQAFADDVFLRAEARLSVEPDLSSRRPYATWDAAVLVLAANASESGWLKEGFTAEKFVRVLTVSLAGHRVLAHIVAVGVAVSIRSGYRESLETVLAAATDANFAAVAEVAAPDKPPSVCRMPNSL